MKESDRGIFENEWEKAFDGAEMAPSETVWSKVEVAVANSEGKNYKRRLLFFKLLAAASVSFAVSLGGWQLYKSYYNQENSIELNADQMIESPAYLDGNDNTSETLLAEQKQSNTDNNSKGVKGSGALENAQNNSAEVTKPTSGTLDMLVEIEEKSKDVLVVNIVDDHGSEALIAENSKEAFSPSKLDNLDVEYFEAELTAVEPQMVPWLSNIQSNTKGDFKGLWAGIGMSAGSFNSNTSSDAASAMSEGLLNTDGSFNSNDSEVSDESTGSAYGFGLNIGTQLSKRFVLMSGLNYTQQTTTSNSNIVALNTNGFSAVDRNTSLSAEASYAYADSYKISNTYELLSVPIQAGYILLDRKFNILLLSGVSNDIFLRQKISDESGQAQSVENTGNDRGYSTYSLSGLIGSEFSYDIGENYILSLQPQLRQTINSFTPEGSKPTFFEVGFKFKYIIK